MNVYKMKGAVLNCFMLFWIFNLNQGVCWSQTSTKKRLIRSTVNECPIIYDSECSSDKLETLSDRFDQAEEFLIGELKNMMLVDSSSFYERKRKEVIELEQVEDDQLEDHGDLKTALEESYLLLSILKPSRSDSLFIKLISSYLNEAPVYKNMAKLSAVINYKGWLYELLDNRFSKETSLFATNRSSLFYNNVLLQYDQPFKTIDAEKQLLDQLITWAALASENSIKYTFDELVIIIYQHRIAQAVAMLESEHSDELFDFIESLYFKSIEMEPDREDLTYNLGVFYHNEAIYLSNRDKSKLKGRELKKEEERIEELMEKSKQLLSP